VLACELAPEYREIIERMDKKRTATGDEVRAWTHVFFRLRDWKPSKPAFDLSRFYTPLGSVNTTALAKELGVAVADAAIQVKKIDKALMMAAVEEILKSVTHSKEFGHRIEFRKGRV